MNCTQRTGHSFGWLIVISHPEKAERELREGPKWRGLEHNGLCLPPDYKPLTAEVKFVYNGIEMSLSRQTEENAISHSEYLVTNPVHSALPSNKRQIAKHFLKIFLALYDPETRGDQEVILSLFKVHS